MRNQKQKHMQDVYLVPLLEALLLDPEDRNVVLKNSKISSFLEPHLGYTLEFMSRLKPMREVVNKLANLGNISMSNVKPLPQDKKEIFCYVSAAFFKNSVVKTATVQDTVLNAGPSLEQLRNLEAELTMQQYDLQQVSFSM